MIGFTLSEKEFDYELQALATGFFPGKRTQIMGNQETSILPLIMVIRRFLFVWRQKPDVKRLVQQ